MIFGVQLHFEVGELCLILRWRLGLGLWHIQDWEILNHGYLLSS